jgi:hypothetical protein
VSAIESMISPYDDAAARDKPCKVAIVGYTHSNRDAPWDSDDWQVWGLNDLHRWVGNTRWDGWFDVHDDKTIEAAEEHVAWLREEHPFPVWMFNPRPEWPSSAQFPVDDLKARFGTYFTNSISWMVAFAITQVEWAAGDGAEIGIYGVDMAVGGKDGGEYGFQRPSCEYFIGLARGMGITVTVAAASDLLKSADVYGEDNPLRVKMLDRVNELDERAAAAEKERAGAQAHVRQMESLLDQIRGGRDTLEYFLGAWFTPVNDGSQGRAANDVRSGAPPS